jgi:phage-related protein
MVVELLDGRVAEENEALPADMKARFRRIVELIQAHGLERMREPHVKHLEGPIWEMRMSGRDRISRALYVTAMGDAWWLSGSSPSALRRRPAGRSSSRFAGRRR